MRRLLPLFLAALVACQVDVEGAPCEIADHCPSGQGCGLDHRCSKRAASAGCELRTPGERRCNETTIEEFSAESDPICGAWVLAMQCENELVCSDKTGAPRCDCAEVRDGIFWADPTGGGDATLVATGAPNPPGCRLRRLTDALARASAYAGGSGATVRTSAEAAMVFDDESFPLQVPEAVTLEAGTTTTLRAEPADTSTPLVELQGVIAGLRIENVGGTGIGIDARCGAAKQPELRGVVLDGADKLETGILVSGACGSRIEDATVRNASGAALVVNAAADALVTVVGGQFADSGVGVELLGGTLEIQPGSAPTEIASNQREGLLISGGTGLRARASGVDVTSNGGTGVVIEAVPATAEVSLRECTIRSNGFTAARSYGSDPARNAGGMLVAQTNSVATFSFTGNTVFANAGDQIGVWSEGTWSFSGGACGDASNAFGCIADGAYALYATSRATVDATFNVWPSDPPTSIVNVPRVSYSPVCTGHAAARTAPACPAQ